MKDHWIDTNSTGSVGSKIAHHVKMKFNKNYKLFHTRQQVLARREMDSKRTITHMYRTNIDLDFRHNDGNPGRTNHGYKYETPGKLGLYIIFITNSE